jgi:cobalt/nickel transport system ATP-binding protein
MPELFTLKNISYCYLDGQYALHDINLSISEGEIVSLIGANGSGKSTLLQLLCGLIHPTSGTITYKASPISEKTLKEASFNRRFRASIGYVFQNPDAQLFCPTVEDELLFGPIQAGLSKEQAFERANSIADMLCIQELFDRPPYMLSGGEKKRVAIGSVLTTNPDILVLDEPLSGLDPKTRAFLIELIFGLHKSGKTIIIATHHLEVVSHFQSRVIVLSEKHTIEKDGSSDDVLKDTDLLLRTNLIGEYPHRHHDLVHKHLYSGLVMHQHTHQHPHPNQ